MKVVKNCKLPIVINIRDVMYNIMNIINTVIYVKLLRQEILRVVITMNFVFLFKNFVSI